MSHRFYIEIRRERADAYEEVMFCIFKDHINRFVL
jgi:hypothetical protein